MSMEAMAWAWSQPVRGTRKLVLLALADWANEFECWPSIPTIQDRCGIGRAQVFSTLADLESVGLISRVPRERDNGSRRSNVYVLATGRGGPVPRTDQSGELDPLNPKGTQREPITPVVPAEPQPQLLPSPVDEVWSTYAATMKVRRVIDDGDRLTIANALKVATVEECKRAIAGCNASDWHMGRDPQTAGRSYKQLSQILRGKRGGRSTREQIDFFIDIADAAGVTGEGVEPVDRTKLSRCKVAVMTAWEFPADERAAAAGDEARTWLAEHGIAVETCPSGPYLGKPRFRSMP